jgi:hypothetical protein
MRRLPTRHGFQKGTDIVPARSAWEGRALKRRHPPRRLTLFSRLTLIVLFCVLGLTATGYQSQTTWRHTLKRGDSLRVKQLSLRNACRTPHVWRVESKGGFIRLDRQAAHILVSPGGTELVGVILDAKRKEKVYHGSVTVECVDCKDEATCRIQSRDVYQVELTVIKQDSGSEGDAKRIQANLVGELERLSLRLDERIRGLEEVEGRLPDGRSVKGYSAVAVEDVIDEVRRRLVGATKDKEVRALGAYAMKHYRPESYLVTLRVRLGAAAAAPRLSPLYAWMLPRPGAFRGPLEEGSIVTTASASAAFNSIRNLLTVLKDNSGRITLKVVSLPEGANIELEAPGGKKYARSTNSDIEDFWMGTYRIKVSKEGFVSILQDNQDVGFGNTVIECQLVKTGEPVLCRFR